MELFLKDNVTNREDGHLASEPHMRVQIRTLTLESSTEYFEKYHGEVLLIVLDGEAIIRTMGKTEILGKGDQALMIDGEKFNILPADEHSKVRIEYVWSPGSNPCKFCWEIDNRFYGNKAS